MPELFHIAGLDRRIKPFFGMLGRAVLNVLERRAARLSTASKMKRRSVDVIFLCKLEKFQ